MSMTKMHFEALAKTTANILFFVRNDASNANKIKIVTEMVIFCKAQNPNFSPDRFRAKVYALLEDLKALHQATTDYNAGIDPIENITSIPKQL